MIKSTFAEEYCRVSGVSTDLIDTIEMIYNDLKLNTLPLSFEQKYQLVRDAARIAMCAGYYSVLVSECADIAE